MLPLLVDNARKSNCSVESDCEPPTYSGLNINIDPLFTSGVNMYDDIEESLGGESVSHVSEANVAESESGITTEARHSLLILNANAAINSYYEDMSLKCLLQRLDAVSSEHLCTSRTSPSSLGEASEYIGTKQASLSHSYLVSRANYRDLRRLDYKLYPAEAPGIIVRRHCVLFLFDPLRAVVLANRLLFVVPDGADSLLHLLQSNMKAWRPPCETATAHPRAFNADADCNETLCSHSQSSGSLLESLIEPSSGSVSFEVHCYEALLATVQELNSGTNLRLGKQVSHLLSLYDHTTMDDNVVTGVHAPLFTPSRSCKLLTLGMQREMQRLKNEINSLSSRLQSYKSGLFESLLAEEDSMALMNLTHLAANPHYYLSPASDAILGLHEPIEILLEASVMDYNSALNSLDMLRTKLVNAEAMASLQLSVSRNALLALNTQISILGAAMAFGGFLAGIFGMNLSNIDTIQSVPNTFEVVTVCLLVLVSVGSAVTTWWFTVTGVLPVRAHN